MVRHGPRPDHDAGLHPACADCGSTGGAYCGGDDRHPIYRKRGLCSRCYEYHHRRGALERYPLSPRFKRDRADRGRGPRIPTGYVSPAMLGCTRDQHAIRDGYDAPAVVAEAEAFAAAWLYRKHGVRVTGWRGAA